MDDNLDSPSEVRILGESNNYLHLIVVGEQGNDKLANISFYKVKSSSYKNLPNTKQENLK